MGDNEFFGYAGEQLDLRRQAVREWAPSGRDGFVVEDIDEVKILKRVFGDTYGLDELGVLRVEEWKLWPRKMETAQSWTFGLLDAICNTSHLSDRWAGFFFVQSDSLDWNNKDTRFWVNEQEIGWEDFRRWQCWELDLEPMQIGEPIARGLALA